MDITHIYKRIDCSGGIERVAFHLINKMKEDGNNINAISSHISPQIIPLLKRRAFILKDRDKGWLKSTGLFYPMFCIQATKMVKSCRDKWGLTVSHGTSSFLADVVVAHSCHGYSLKQRWKAGKKRFILNPLNYFLCLTEMCQYKKGAKRIVAVSQSTKAEICETYNIPEEKIKVIPNGIELNEFSDRKDGTIRSKIRAKYGINNNAFVVIFAANEFERKGLAFLIYAIARLNKEDIFLFVIGGDNAAPYKEMTAGLGIDKKVIFTGRIYKGMSGFYKAGDVFVLPVDYEPFGLVCMEAMASGLPVLATRVGGIKEYMVDGANGFFIDRNADSIVNRIELLYNDYRLRTEIGQNGRLIAQKYSWDKIGRMYIDVCREVEEMRQQNI